MISRLMQLGQGVSSRRRNLWYRFLGVRLEGYVWMRRIGIPRQWKSIQLSRGVALDQGVQLVASGVGDGLKIRIGEGTYVNRYTTLDGHGDLRIGRNCLIGPYCYLTDADHSIDGKEPVKDLPMRVSFLRIEDEVWLGSHVVVLPGVTIGKGAVIGAGSVVTRDIPPGAIAYGSPAKVQRVRSIDH